MIDARECAGLAEQALEEAHEAREEAVACRKRSPAKADRWDRAARALTDAAEALQRASDEIASVSGEPDLVKLCTKGGCKNPAEPPHRCPYKSDIGGDDETLCECCDGCQYECAMDI